MAKTVAIIASSTAFAIIGLIAIGISSPLAEVSGTVPALVVTLTPPIVGASLGLVVGCIAVACGVYIDRDNLQKRDTA